VNEAVLLADRVLVFSPSPAHVALEVVIDVPRPRDAAWRRSAEFLAYGGKILSALHHKTPARNHDNGVTPAPDGAAISTVRLGAATP
jgi:NitT/TauT family transport system ATP-binding protein